MAELLGVLAAPEQLPGLEALELGISRRSSVGFFYQRLGVHKCKYIHMYIHMYIYIYIYISMYICTCVYVDSVQICRYADVLYLAVNM